jgi:hypothetical protein
VLFSSPSPVAIKSNSSNFRDLENVVLPLSLSPNIVISTSSQTSSRSTRSSHGVQLPPSESVPFHTPAAKPRVRNRTSVQSPEIREPDLLDIAIESTYLKSKLVNKQGPVFKRNASSSISRKQSKKPKEKIAYMCDARMTDFKQTRIDEAQTVCCGFLQPYIDGLPRAAEEKAAAEAKRAAEKKAAANAKRATDEKAVAEAKRAAAGPPPAATALSGLATPACPVAAVLSSQTGAIHLLSKFSLFVLAPIRQLLAYYFLHIASCILDLSYAWVLRSCSRWVGSA